MVNRAGHFNNAHNKFPHWDTFSKIIEQRVQNTYDPQKPTQTSQRRYELKVESKFRQPQTNNRYIGKFSRQVGKNARIGAKTRRQDRLTELQNCFVPSTTVLNYSLKPKRHHHSPSKIMPSFLTAVPQICLDCIPADVIIGIMDELMRTKIMPSLPSTPLTSKRGSSFLGSALYPSWHWVVQTRARNANKLSAGEVTPSRSKSHIKHAQWIEAIRSNKKSIGASSGQNKWRRSDSQSISEQQSSKFDDYGDINAVDIQCANLCLGSGTTSNDKDKTVLLNILPTSFDYLGRNILRHKKDYSHALNQRPVYQCELPNRQNTRWLLREYLHSLIRGNEKQIQLMEPSRKIEHVPKRNSGNKMKISPAKGKQTEPTVLHLKSVKQNTKTSHEV